MFIKINNIMNIIYYFNTIIYSTRCFFFFFKYLYFIFNVRVIFVLLDRQILLTSFFFFDYIKFYIIKYCVFKSMESYEIEY